MVWNRFDMILKRQGKEDLNHNGGNIHGDTNLNNGNFNVNGGDYLINGEMFIPTGVLFPYVSDKIPEGWLICDGAEVEISKYTRLHKIIGNKFGESSQPSTHFLLPDLRGRTIIGSGTDGFMTDRNIGRKGGSEKHTISVDEMPSHSHSGKVDSAGEHVHSVDTGTIDDSEFLAQDGQPPAVDSNDYKNAYNTNASGEHTHNISIDAVGGNKPHNNMPPYLVMNYIIRC